MNFLTPAAFPYRWLALALLAAALWGHGWVKGNASGRAEGVAFQAETRTTGEIAAKAAQVQQARDQARKEASDASYTKALALLSADHQRLLNARAGGSYLPPALAGASRSDLACFDRAELESALGRLDRGVSIIVGEGDQVALRLKLAVEWATR